MARTRRDKQFLASKANVGNFIDKPNALSMEDCDLPLQAQLSTIQAQLQSYQSYPRHVKATNCRAALEIDVPVSSDA